MQLSVQLPDAIAKNFLQTVPENQRSQVLSGLLSDYLQNVADLQNTANTPQHATTDVALADEQQRRQKRQALLDNLPPMTKKFAGIIENISDAEIEQARLDYLLGR